MEDERQVYGKQKKEQEKQKKIGQYEMGQNISPKKPVQAVVAKLVSWYIWAGHKGSESAMYTEEGNVFAFGMFNTQLIQVFLANVRLSLSAKENMQFDNLRAFVERCIFPNSLRWQQFYDLNGGDKSFPSYTVRLSQSYNSTHGFVEAALSITKNGFTPRDLYKQFKGPNREINIMLDIDFPELPSDSIPPIDVYNDASREPSNDSTLEAVARTSRWKGRGTTVRNARGVDRTRGSADKGRRKTLHRMPSGDPSGSGTASGSASAAGSRATSRKRAHIKVY